ncbi:MICOS complex subunit Mic10-like [Ctenocephalides felis]|uniref:MICOS complex subunit Mic10-like n=1 Tax=Ctenocephalides felis TaxID=7515 RepID=UPI000E6E2E1D|nr:MICOS complex subunit Mic10-like [Ctenocephalides felis]XP_026479053.1 MICOS complex subunit Mic10-like [Ctenocephalides felis]
MSTHVEDELSRRWDRCMKDGLIKFGGGIAIGTVFSVLFFKRKKWPIILGGGFGIGLAYSNCERDVNALFTPGTKGPCEVKS